MRGAPYGGGMRTRILAALLLVSVLVAAGCGSSSSSSSTSNTTTSASSSTSGTSTSTSASTTTQAKSQKENLPPGDIPDNIAYVTFTSPDGYAVKAPESFSRSTQGKATTFTDKLNTIAIESQPAKAAPTPATAKSQFVPLAQKASKGFVLQKIDTLTRPAGKVVRIVYQAESKPDPVTGKTRPDVVEEYLFFHNGKLIVLTLTGPKTADNVDPWKLVSSSVRYTK